MDIISPVIPIKEFFDRSFSDVFLSIRAIKSEGHALLPSLVIRQVGKESVQLLVSAESDIEAVALCQEAGNFLKRNHGDVETINLFSAEFQIPVYPDYEEETARNEAWCYMSLNYFES